MDITLLQYIAEQTGLAAFAALALVFLWLTMRESIKRERENAARHRIDRDIMRQALENVTRSVTQLSSLIQELRDDLRSYRK